MEVNLFEEGINLMTLGMGFVFIFLLFLVFAVTAMSRLLTSCTSADSTSPPKQIINPTVIAPVIETDSNDQLIAVMVAAIHHKIIQRKKAQSQAY